MVSRHCRLPIAQPLPDNLGPLDLNTGLQERQDWDEAGMLGNRDLTVALVIEAHAGHWT